MPQQYTYDALSNITNSRLPETSSTTPNLSTATADADSTDSTTDNRREYRNNLLIRDGRTRYHYDEAGRLIRKETTRLSRKPDIWHYRYNAFDQLTDVYTPDRQWWHYTYDAFGRRTTKQHLTGEGAVLERTDYAWDDTQLIERSAPQGVMRWSYQPNTYTPITQTTDQAAIDREFFAVITDLVGTPTELIDPYSTHTAGSAHIDLWGRTTWSGRTSTPLRFPGQLHDAETGLHYNLYRTYDPASGRYICGDPLGLEPAPNPHSYTHNPLIWLDPLGLAPESCRQPTYGNGGHIDNISPEDARRIQNAANARGVTIHVVGSRATGSAGPFSDWDYVIEGINSRMRSRIQSSLPQGAVELGHGRRIDIFRRNLVEGMPYVSFHPN
ncbi:RHS repeat-associated core domain-containing protein [Nocardia bhagyanarayanae]|uniref:RHS repeat-associated core domain-containing protein n=1 Tax=Nocardia bhagyanarayanae TaxID=1215925 RepID=UPI001FEAB702|nr:RHS repeat-associated core domain-containing protein [Nocardia bhagyanarayanae]